MSKQVGALWSVDQAKLDNPNENYMFSGNIETLAGDVKVGVFKNTNKKDGDNQPEFHIVRLDKQEK